MSANDASKSSTKRTMFHLDPELLKLNEKIKWPKKMSLIQTARGVAVVLFLLFTSGLGKSFSSRYVKN
jgi:preprotein translocase subunit SecE